MTDFEELRLDAEAQEHDAPTDIDSLVLNLPELRDWLEDERLISPESGE